MKYILPLLFMTLVACQPADQDPQAPSAGNGGQSQSPKPGDASPLVITESTDSGRPNQISQSTKGQLEIVKTFTFQTDTITRYKIDPDLQGLNCVNNSPTMWFYWREGDSDSGVLPVNSPFVLKVNKAYKLVVKVTGIYCDSVDLQFAFQRVPL